MSRFRISGVRMSGIGLALALCLAPSMRASAQDRPPVPLAERARGSERIVVGRVSTVTPRWQTNAFGDRLIVSTLHVAVDETLKGAAEAAVDVEIEGGTIGELTLHVSDIEPFTAGERAVFYLRRGSRGTFVPHLRGQGLLKLDQSGRVRGSGVTMADIRRSAVEAAR